MALAGWGLKGFYLNHVHEFREWPGDLGSAEDLFLYSWFAAGNCAEGLVSLVPARGDNARETLSTTIILFSLPGVCGQSNRTVHVTRDFLGCHVNGGLSYGRISDNHVFLPEHMQSQRGKLWMWRSQRASSWPRSGSASAGAAGLPLGCALHTVGAHVQVNEGPSLLQVPSSCACAWHMVVA